MNGAAIKVGLFVVISAWLLSVSRKSLRAPGSHGSYRFFAWESILGLILMNSDLWFTDPLAAPQIVSWSFLSFSLIMLGAGIRQLVAIGRPTSQRQDKTLLGFEKTSILVTTGIYSHIRHPLYASLFFLALGAFLKCVMWYSVILVVLATLLLVATAKADEAECRTYFGPAYEEYIQRTKMFVPFLF